MVLGGWAVSYERGTPVGFDGQTRPRQLCNTPKGKRCDLRGSQAACPEHVFCMLLSLYFPVTCNPSRADRLPIITRAPCQAHLQRTLMSESSTESGPFLEATQGQMDGFFSQLSYKCHLEEVASVGDLRFALNSTPGWPPSNNHRLTSIQTKNSVCLTTGA